MSSSSCIDKHVPRLQVPWSSISPNPGLYAPAAILLFPGDFVRLSLATLPSDDVCLSANPLLGLAALPSRQVAYRPLRIPDQPPLAVIPLPFTLLSLPQ